MAVRRLSENQPDSFQFTPENEAWARTEMAKYPEGRQASAVIALMWRAQAQNGGWVSEPAIRYVADLLDMPYMRAYEIATFYTMFKLEPSGRHVVQVCTTTPCWLRGSDDMVKVCKEKIAETPNTVSKDGLFSWEEVECLGACCNAPMAQIGSDYYEDLTADSFARVLDALKAGKTPKPGPQSDRHGSEPAGGLTTLTDETLYAKEPRQDGGA